MLFILNRQERVVGVLKNSGKNSVPFFNDLLTEDLATGSETFEFTTVSRNGIGQHLVVGNFIAFKKGKSYKLFQIMQTEEDHQDELYITVYAECAGLQLINSVFRGVKIVSASFERVMQTLLSDTSWNVGILPYGLATTYDLDIEQASVYSLLQTYAQQYGVELEFRVELNRGKISKKYIDGYYNRGKVTGKRFTYERDIEGIVRKTDATELYTALIGRGNNEISFKDVTVDGIDKPMGQDFVANQSAYEKYNNNGYHIVGIYECDTDDAKDLLRKTHKRLLEVSEPKVEYDISVLLLCELLGEKWNEVAIGDTISVFDNAFYPPIMVSARVSKLQTSMTDKNANKCTLANFIEVKSNITSEMRKIASQLQGYVDNRFPIGSSDIQDGAVGMDKISDIYTQTITTDILKAGKVETEKLIAKEAEITNAKIENLKAGFIEADKIITDTIVANKAEFDKLEAKVGQIDTLVSGNISSENIQTGGITGSNLNMDTIFVKDANILDLSASKLTAGEINTSKVVISSADGGMRLVGSTQQFVDENNRIRIQLGKDANGDFDFYILAENGDILFNTRGITGNAIENGLIKENMVSDGAIGGKKINWSSFVTEFNKDSNTHKLNSSKVLLDGTNQTLDIHFNQLKSKVDDNVSQTESNTTQIGINQGKINTLIQDTTITKDGQTLKLKDEYSKLEQTVGGLKSTVGEQQTTINQNTGKITATESKVSTLEQTVNGFNSELSHVKTTIDEQEEAINSVNSALSGKANSNDVYKKSETMTTSAINSAINQSADSIKLGISNTYETKTNVENKISSANTTTLNSAKSYADTKKNEAITQAGKDADSKVNSAKNELNTAINKKANSSDVYTKSQVYTKEETNSQIKVAKDEINLGVSNTYETKLEVDNKINAIEVGGTNFMRNSSFQNEHSAVKHWGGNGGDFRSINVPSALSGKGLEIGGTNYQGVYQVPISSEIGVYTISFYLRTDSANPLIMFSRWEGFCDEQLFTATNSWTRCSYVVNKTRTDANAIVFYLYHGTDYNKIQIHSVQVERGNKATDWSPSPFDTVSDIADAKTEAINSANNTLTTTIANYYTKEETNSQINIAKEAINLGVSNTYETKANVESKVNNAVNNIQVGGRNLWRFTKEYDGTKYTGWVDNNNASRENIAPHTTVNGFGVQRIATAWTDRSQRVTIEPNTNYTLSAWVKWENTVGELKFYTNDGTMNDTNVTSQVGTTDYKRVSITFNSGSATESTCRFECSSNTPYLIYGLKLEKGNKATDWTPAPEDIDSAIGTKANASDVYNKTEVYTKAETNSQINVAKDSITNTVSQNYVTKGDASNTYATKSEVTQTANQITYSFSSSGGMNLVKDGQFKSWEFNAGKWEYNEDAFRIYGRYSSDPEGTSIGFYSATDGKVDLYQFVKFKPDTTYTFRADIYKEPNIWWYSVIIDFYDGNGNYLGSHTCTEAGNTFTTPSNCYKGVLTIRHGGTSNFSGYYVLYVNNVAIYEGTMELPYSPHPEEIYEGITKIDANGIQVSHIGANTTTHMNSQGFFIYNSQGETVGSLATETGLSVVNANKVYADNIRNIYEGDGTLYVNHNYTGDSDGTSSRPFKTFADLRTYLEVTPIINKDVTVNIVSTSEITEPLVMDNLSGRGTLKFQYAKTCIHRTNSTHMWCISMANINLPLQIHGGRSSYNTSDGAILCDNGNQHGIKLVNCPNFYIGSIAINCKNWGIHLSNCQGTTTNVDFCKTYCAFELRDRSHVYDSDACGNCGDFFRVFTGSIFIYGSNGGGYRPYGNKIENSGRYLLVGGERNQTNSFRTPPPAPTTSDQYGTWSMRDYGYFTYGRNGVNVNSWNPGSKKIQQGEWSGYGNNYGFAFFDDSNIRSWLSNGTPKDGSTITLKRASSGGYSSSQPVYLCGATNTSCSGTPSGVKSYGNIGSLAWGETKTFNIPTSFVNDLKSGAIKSVCFYDSSGASYVKIESVSIKLKANKPV